MTVCVFFVYRREDIFLLISALWRGNYNKKVSQTQIENLEIVSYEKNRFDHGQCVICLETYIESDKVRIFKCSHYFHVHCSDQWLLISGKCPLCKQTISDACDVPRKGL